MCCAPTIERGLVRQHPIFHVGHRRSAEDQHQLGGILIFVNQELQGGGKAFGGAGHIGVLVDHKNDPFFFRQFENIFQCRLKGHKRVFCRNAACIFQYAFAEVFKILLGVALHAHKINRLLILDELGQKRSFPDTPTAIQDGKFKLF